MSKILEYFVQAKKGKKTFKWFEYINKSLLAKFTWELSMKIEALWVKCLISKYVKKNDFLNAPNIKGRWACNVIQMGK